MHPGHENIFKYSLWQAKSLYSKDRKRGARMINPFDAFRATVGLRYTSKAAMHMRLRSANHLLGRR